MSGPSVTLARKWAFALVPAFGLWELGAHVVQTSGVVTEAQWSAARDAVSAAFQPGDLVVFAPYWADPLGRKAFGEKLAGIATEARPDETRFPRAFEVSIRGKHEPALEGWTKRESRKVGPVTITTLENPSPAKVLDDLVLHASPSGMSVSRVDGGSEQECRWVQGPTTSGGLGSGPAMPGDRFACNGGSFVGEAVIFDLGYRPRRCLFSPPGGGSSVLRVRFTGVAFGAALHGHAGLQYENERDEDGAPITMIWRAGERVLGKITHADGDGWKGFELSTTDLQGQRGDLVVELASSQGGRQFCFEADTR